MLIWILWSWDPCVWISDDRFCIKGGVEITNNILVCPFCAWGNHDEWYFADKNFDPDTLRKPTPGIREFHKKNFSSRQEHTVFPNIMSEWSCVYLNLQRTCHLWSGAGVWVPDRKEIKTKLTNWLISVMTWLLVCECAYLSTLHVAAFSRNSKSVN